MASNWPQNQEDFLKWFWKGTNGNNLIKKLNNVEGQKDCIRREKESPAIYCVVLNDDGWKKECGISRRSKRWKLCKVGFTQNPTKEGDNNRMEQVMKEIGRNGYTDAKVIFVLKIGATDTTPYIDTEKRIRKKVGKPIKREEAKKIDLPVPTEWVLTTQSHIDSIVRKKDVKTEQVKQSREGDVIDFFKTLDFFAEEPPEEYKKLL